MIHPFDATAEMRILCTKGLVSDTTPFALRLRDALAAAYGAGRAFQASSDAETMRELSIPTTSERAAIAEAAAEKAIATQKQMGEECDQHRHTADAERDAARVALAIVTSERDEARIAHAHCTPSETIHDICEWRVIQRAHNATAGVGRRWRMIEHRKRSCGRLIFEDDEAQSIAHEDPECAAFLESISESGPHETREIQPEAMGAHFDALSQRVKARK